MDSAEVLPETYSTIDENDFSTTKERQHAVVIVVLVPTADALGMTWC